MKLEKDEGWEGDDVSEGCRVGRDDVCEGWRWEGIVLEGDDVRGGY